MNFAPNTHKIVLVLDEYLGPGLAANTAAVLALSLGEELGSAVLGGPVADGSGSVHAALTNVPMPILRAPEEKIKELAARARDAADLYMVDVTDAAQTTTTYEDYTTKLARMEAEAQKYLGIGLCGPKKGVQSLTGSLGLFR